MELELGIQLNTDKKWERKINKSVYCKQIQQVEIEGSLQQARFINKAWDIYHLNILIFIDIRFRT